MPESVLSKIGIEVEYSKLRAGSKMYSHYMLVYKQNIDWLFFNFYTGVYYTYTQMCSS